MRTFRNLVIISAASSAVCAGALAQNYDGVDAIEIDDFIGTVEVTVGGKRVSLERTNGADTDYPVLIDRDEGVLSIRSYEDPVEAKWWRDVRWRKNRNGENAFANYLKDYPTIRISAPAGTNLLLDDAVIALNAGDLRSDFKTGGGHIEGVVGDLRTADIGIHGSADLKIGDVAEELEIAIHGSGDFRAGSAKELAARIHGSGDITIGDIGGEASATIHGSGDIDIGDVDGAGVFEIHGSGDISAGVLDGGAEISIMGSGDISLASVAGRTEVSIHGSGDSEIAAGRAEDLRVRINGSGEFEFRGLATNPDVAANSSGSIYVAKAEGPIRARGDGDIRIAGRDYGDDD